MIWVMISALLVLVLMLVIAVAYNAMPDRTAGILATLASLLVTASLLFYTVAVSLRLPDTDVEVITAFSILSGICASASWLFILLGLLRMAGGLHLRMPGPRHRASAYSESVPHSNGPNYGERPHEPTAAVDRPPSAVDRPPTYGSESSTPRY